MKSKIEVTVIIPCYNESKFISKCLDSIIALDYPKDKLEILVFDGGSQDGTLKIVREYIKKNGYIKLYHNAERIQAAALNKGIRKASGDIIIRMDAHCIYSPDYILKAVSILKNAEAVNVGGSQTGKGTDYFTLSLSFAMANPFASGNAVYRSSNNRQQEVDTVFLGAWHKKDLEEVGGFDESFAVNEDYELNYRLRKAGGKIIFSPEIKSIYYVRSSIIQLIKQYFRYGFWKVKTIKKHPASLRIRQTAAPFFVLALLLTSFLYAAGYHVFVWLLSFSYLTAFILFFRGFFNMKAIKYLPPMLLITIIMHVAWGFGFLTGVFFWFFKKT
jgi:glycosyltransferase involved in cell wall biosynthesis